MTELEFTKTEVETVARLVELLAQRDPFVHVRFGDGDVFFATGTGPKTTADGEEWSRDLQHKLLSAWLRFGFAEVRLLLGDLETYAVSDGCEAEWEHLLDHLRLCRDQIEFVHMEALRAGFGHAIPLYQAIRDDPRRKAYVAPGSLKPAAAMLGAEWVEVPLHRAHLKAAQRAGWLISGEFDIVLFSAGRGGKIMQGYLAQEQPQVTQIDIGSGLDLVYDGVRRGTDLGIDVDRLKGEYREAGLLV